MEEIKENYNYRMIKFRREQYIERHKIQITTPGASALFYRNVRAYNTPGKPKIWDIKLIRPSISDDQLALERSEYFT